LIYPSGWTELMRLGVTERVRLLMADVLRTCFRNSSLRRLRSE
jgi:hypothetical protein